MASTGAGVCRFRKFFDIHEKGQQAFQIRAWRLRRSSWPSRVMMKHQTDKEHEE